MIKAVFDSTALISAFLTRSGVTGELVDLAGKAFVLTLAPEIVAETRRKLLTSKRIRGRYGYTDEEVERYCSGLAVVTGGNMMRGLPRLSGVVRDPNDDVIVAAALVAQADYLVTRDKDLLSLGGYQGIRMITPEAFRGILRAA